MTNYLLFTIRFEYTSSAILARVHALKPDGSIAYWIETREYTPDTTRTDIVADVLREMMGMGRVAVYQPMLASE